MASMLEFILGTVMLKLWKGKFVYVWESSAYKWKLEYFITEVTLFK